MLTQDTTTTRRRRRGAHPDARPTAGRAGVRPRRAYEAARYSDDDVQCFVARTTTTSGVPVYVEDAGVLDQLARLLS